MKELMTRSFGLTRYVRVAASTLLAFAVSMIPAPAFSQSCALCYTQAASSGRQMIEALRSELKS